MIETVICFHNFNELTNKLCQIFIKKIGKEKNSADLRSRYKPYKHQGFSQHPLFPQYSIFRTPKHVYSQLTKTKNKTYAYGYQCLLAYQLFCKKENRNLSLMQMNI